MYFLGFIFYKTVVSYGVPCTLVPIGGFNLSWDDFKNQRLDDIPKEPTYKSAGTGHYYCIFRIGKKFKADMAKGAAGQKANNNKVINPYKSSLNAIKGFERHMEREQDTPNANSKIKNEILIGSSDIYNDVENYIQGIKLRSNNVIARELLLTASPQFFRGLPEQQLYAWKEVNKEWLLKNFGDNVRYAVLHKDESTWHIHALIVPVFNNKLCNNRYFDGIKKFRAWQDNYAESMQKCFKSLNRGVRFSKAKHIEIRHFYTMVNAKVDEKDLQQLCSKAVNSELLEIKIKALQNTLGAYQKINKQTNIEKDNAIKLTQDLKKNVKELQADKELFKEAIEVLSQKYKLPQNAIKEVVNYISNSLEREK